MGQLRQREKMIETQLAARGISDERILEAFRVVPREAFLPDDIVDSAYVDAALPIGREQTISQPFIVALTASALQVQLADRVLEVGTGSGYAAAILSRLATHVYSVERIPELAEEAQVRLRELGFHNVDVVCRDGTLGWPDHAPFDGIAVASGGPIVPPALKSQLTIGGRMIIPVGSSEDSQVLKRVTRESRDQFREEPLANVRFVPLIGAQGWH